VGELTWGGQLAVDHDDAFVHLEVPQEGGAAVITLEPHVARLVGRSLTSHAQSLLRAELDVTPSPTVVTLAALRAAYAEYQSTGDLHELARAVGNILDAGGD
jgi:hypothetical protein